MANTAAMIQQNRRRWTPLILTQLVVVLAVLVAGVTGAGVLRGRDGGGDVLQIVQAASTTAAKQPTFRAAFSFHVSGSGVDVTSTGSMLIDTVRKVASGTIQAPIVGTLSTVSAGDVTYTQLPGGRADAAGHHWIGLRLLKAGAAAPVGGQDPLAALKLISDPKKVVKVGTERIHGVQTDHYSVLLDPARFADTLAKSNLNLSVPPGALDSLKDAKINLWIDSKNLPRRMTIDFAISSVKATLSFDFLDYGKPFTVTVPAASDVTEVSSVQEYGALLAGAVRR